MLCFPLVSTKRFCRVSFGTSRYISLVHRARRPKTTAAGYAGHHFRAKRFAQTTRPLEVRQETSNRGSSFSGSKEEVPSPILTFGRARHI
jgi:hypothetical protein